MSLLESSSCLAGASHREDVPGEADSSASFSFVWPSDSSGSGKSDVGNVTAASGCPASVNVESISAVKEESPSTVCDGVSASMRGASSDKVVATSSFWTSSD